MSRLCAAAAILGLASACTTGTGPIGTGADHPCEGYRTDALWFDDDSVGFLGCGTDAIGVGLFETSNGGGSWSAVDTSPAGIFETFRSTHAHRAADGILYVAGTGSNGARVLAVDTSSAPYAVTVEFESQSQTWNSFHVGTYLRNADGYAVAESLTGSDLAFKSSPSAAWQDGYPWWTTGDGGQVLDMAMYDDRFYGCGSTIIQPPKAFLPDTMTADDFGLATVELSNFQGEMWSIDVDAGGIIVGGVDQDRDVGMIFTADSPTSVSSWLATDVSAILGSDPTWVRGVCRDGDHVVAVGEYSVGDTGFILDSPDNGDTWTTVSSGSVPSVQRCQFVGGGKYVVAGGQGFMAIY